MSSEDPRGRILAALSGEENETVPVAVFTQSATTSQMEATGASWPEAHTDPAKMAVLGSAQADIFRFDTVRAPFCITIEAERLGCTVDLGSSVRQPLVRETPFFMNPFDGSTSDIDDLLSASEFSESGRAEVLADAIGIMASTHGDRAVVAGMTGPLTTLTQMVSAENMVLTTMTYPDIVRKWSDAITRRLTEHAKNLADSDADVIMIAEASGSPDVITPDMFDDLTGNNLKSMICAVHNAKTTLHICGHALQIADRMVATGTDAVSVEGRCVDPYDAVKAFGGRVALVGNVGAVSPLMSGHPVDVAAAACRSRDAGFDVIAPGCGLPISTPDCNLQALTYVREPEKFDIILPQSESA